MTAPAKAEWTEIFLSYYLNHHFINIFGLKTSTLGSEVLTFKIIPKLPVLQRPKILPLGFICDINSQKPKPIIQPFTVAINNEEVQQKRERTFIKKIISLIQWFGKI